MVLSQSLGDLWLKRKEGNESSIVTQQSVERHTRCIVDSLPKRGEAARPGG